MAGTFQNVLGWWEGCGLNVISYWLAANNMGMVHKRSKEVDVLGFASLLLEDEEVL